MLGFFVIIQGIVEDLAYQAGQQGLVRLGRIQSALKIPRIGVGGAEINNNNNKLYDKRDAEFLCTLYFIENKQLT